MATCPHGFAPGQCLICQTLGTTPGRTSATATDRRGRFRTRRTPVPAPPPLSPYPTYEPPAPLGRRRHPLSTVALVVLAGLVVVVGIWIVVGAVFALLRLIELVVLAGAAGWIGYRVGHWRGRHEH